MIRRTALTIAGSDPSGGAGLQADLKTFHQHGVFGSAVVTLVTAQNMREVQAVEVMTATCVASQLEALVKMGPFSVIKVGALGNAEVVRVVAEWAPKLGGPLVVDPVLISSSGKDLLDESGREAFLEYLVPIADLVLPNVPEAALLTGLEVTDVHQCLDAARQLVTRGASAVLLKGGHLALPYASDWLVSAERIDELRAPRVPTPHTHGTGCAFAASIAARMARGESALDAARGAKAWLTEALTGSLFPGEVTGTLNHFVPVDDPDT